MTWQTLAGIWASIFSIIGVVYAIMNKAIFGRLDVLEHQIKTMVPREDVLEITNTKIEPIKEDISDMKRKLDQIYDFLVFKNNSRIERGDN